MDDDDFEKIKRMNDERMIKYSAEQLKHINDVVVFLDNISKPHREFIYSIKKKELRDKIIVMHICAMLMEGNSIDETLNILSECRNDIENFDKKVNKSD